jgi:hypothetical protein
MKQRISYLIIAGLFLSLVLISCKTTDTDGPASLVEGATPQDLTGPADDASLEALAQAAARTKEARSWAEYMNGEKYCPDEWAAAEKDYAAARDRSDKPETKADVYARVAEWDRLTGIYAGIRSQAFPGFIGEQEERLAEARQKAVDAGAEELVPDRLAVADGVTKTALEKYGKGYLYGALDEGKAAWDRYGILETLALAHGKQQEADDNDFFSLDEENYMMAADAGNKAVELYDAGTLADSRDKADEALVRFNQVINNGYRAIVEESAAGANEWKEAALEVRADVAVKSDFAAAESALNRAHVALRAEQYTEAVTLFDEAGALYEAAHDNALAKRDVATEALDRAEQKIAESEEKALQADEVIGGGE